MTSMKTHDVDDIRHERIERPRKKSVDSSRKSSIEKPGFPRGIPGLREDDKPKPIPAAGKPSRPRQPEDIKKYVMIFLNNQLIFLY